MKSFVCFLFPFVLAWLQPALSPPSAPPVVEKHDSDADADESLSAPPLPPPTGTGITSTAPSRDVTTVRWDVKPAERETSLHDLQARVKQIRSHGVAWRSFDRVHIAYGIYKLVVTAELPGAAATTAVDDLEEEVRQGCAHTLMNKQQQQQRGKARTS